MVTFFWILAAQQYYIEYGNDLNEERFYSLVPNYIPDYCLQRDNAVDMWHNLVLQAYKKVHTNTMSVFMNFCPVLDFFIRIFGNCEIFLLSIFFREFTKKPDKNLSKPTSCAKELDIFNLLLTEYRLHNIRFCEFLSCFALCSFHNMKRKMIVQSYEKFFCNESSMIKQQQFKDESMIILW